MPRSPYYSLEQNDLFSFFIHLLNDFFSGRSIEIGTKNKIVRLLNYYGNVLCYGTISIVLDVFIGLWLSANTMSQLIKMNVFNLNEKNIYNSWFGRFTLHKFSIWICDLFLVASINYNVHISQSHTQHNSLQSHFCLALNFVWAKAIFSTCSSSSFKVKKNYFIHSVDDFENIFIFVFVTGHNTTHISNRI